MTLQLLYTIIIALVVAFFILLFSMAISILYRKRVQHRQHQLKKLLFDVFAEYENNPNYEVPKNKHAVVKATLKSESGFNFVCKNLVLLHSIFRLQTNVQAFRFVTDYGIDKRIRKMLQSKDWFILAKGIQWSYELDLMNHVSSIKHYINHNNIVVRREAQLAVTWFMGWKSMKFLTHITHPISLWQQIRIMDALQKHPNDIKLEWAKEALESKNHDVVALVIRAATRHRVTMLSKVIAEVTEHKNSMVSQLARDFNLQTAELLQSEVGNTLTPIPKKDYGNR